MTLWLALVLIGVALVVGVFVGHYLGWVAREREYLVDSDGRTRR